MSSIKVISKHSATWFFITASFCTFNLQNTRLVDQRVPMVDQTRQTFIFDPTIHYVKGCHSINKQFSVDSFFDWECYNTGFASRCTHFHQTTDPLSRVTRVGAKVPNQLFLEVCGAFFEGL